MAGDLRAVAEQVLRANDSGGYTVPATLTYPHQWNWDSALCALGWAELDPARAWTELETLAGARDRNGMLPSIAFSRRTRDPSHRPGLYGALSSIARPRARYHPGPGWWGRRMSHDRRRISAITQPPVAATCMRLLFHEAPDERRARALLGPFHAWHRFLLSARDPHGRGEPVVIHPWETGRDNAVEWDAPLWRVIPEVTVLHRRDTDHVAPAERPSDEHYRRYLTLVRRGTAAGWPQEQLAREGPFRVLDPGFSGILARACSDLAWLARELGEQGLAEESHGMAERVAASLAARVAGDGLVRAVDLVDGATQSPTSAGCALALLAPGLPKRAVAAGRELVLVGELSSDYGVRSLAAGHPERDERNYWRGPAWSNVTWLAAHALAENGEGEAAARLRARHVAAVEGAGMREYFAPSSGEGLGAQGFSWSAAITLRVLAGAYRPSLPGRRGP